MSFLSWLSRSAARLNRVRTQRPSQRPAFRPCLESLEDRCLLTAGAFDPTFGNGAGYVSTALSSGIDKADYALIQPDGKIIEAGQANNNASGLVRFNPNGSLDTSFGTGGEVLGPPTMPIDYAAMAALYPTTGTANDGKIILVSISKTFSVTRYNPNGTLDASFGTNGIATANFGSNLGTLGSSWAVIQPDGKIAVVGPSSDGKTLELARFNANGSLDTTFGQGGLVTTPLVLPGQTGPGPDQTIVLQPNGGLIVSTEATGHWVLIGYNSNGSLNSSFGTGGFVRTPPIGNYGDNSVGFESAALYPATGTVNDGKIVMIGFGYTPNNIPELLVRRYNPNGTLDPTFGNGGTSAVTTDGVTSAFGVIIQPDGKVVVTCESHINGYPNVVRFNTDGTLDSTFGNDGIVATPIGTFLPMNGMAMGLALQPNGDIVAAGTAWNGPKYNFLLTRYLGDSPGLTIAGFPTTVAAGTVETITVTMKDANGNVLTGYTGTVYFTSSDPQAVLPANYSFTAADQGTHTFATLKTAGIQTLNIADTVNPLYASSLTGIQVYPAAATHFVLSGPLTIDKGTAFSITVTVEDAYGNIVTGFLGGNVVPGYMGTVQFASSDGDAVLPDNYTFTAADAGVHTFTKLKFKTKGMQTITVIDTALGTILGSLTVNVT